MAGKPGPLHDESPGGLDAPQGGAKAAVTCRQSARCRRRGAGRTVNGDAAEGERALPGKALGKLPAGSVPRLPHGGQDEARRRTDAAFRFRSLSFRVHAPEPAGRRLPSILPSSRAAVETAVPVPVKKPFALAILVAVAGVPVLVRPGHHVSQQKNRTVQIAHADH